MTTSTTFEQSSVVVDGVPVRVLQAGDGEPLVVLTGADLTRGYELLAGMCRVIALDQGEVALDLLRQLGLDHVTLLASSLAAPHAVAVARSQPELVRALILESPCADAGPDFEAQLDNLTQPTLVVCGTQDTAASRATGRRYRELIPRCHFVMVYDAGHLPSNDRPEAFAEVVGDYVQRLEAFVVQRDSGMLFP